MVDEIAIKKRFELLAPALDERLRRLVASAEAEALGRGGMSLVSEMTGVSRRAIRIGKQELLELQGSGAGASSGSGPRIRKPGGGRKKTVDKDPSLTDDLNALVDPITRGDPESPLRWTCKSVRKLAAELRSRGHTVSHSLVAELLDDMGYSLQANRKTREGSAHPDRDAQFEYINARVQTALAKGEPAISVDTKKKELVGDFKNESPPKTHFCITEANSMRPRCGTSDSPRGIMHFHNLGVGYVGLRAGSKGKCKEQRGWPVVFGAKPA
jgi:hypothetical protein